MCFLSAADCDDKGGTDDNDEDHNDSPHHQGSIATNEKNKQVIDDASDVKKAALQRHRNVSNRQQQW